MRPRKCKSLPPKSEPGHAPPSPFHAAIEAELNPAAGSPRPESLVFSDADKRMAGQLREYVHDGLRRRATPIEMPSQVLTPLP